MTKKCDVIVDLQFGSTGKGLIAGYLAEKYKYDTVVNANMPNAGHTFIDSKGRKFVHKVLPNGIVSPNLRRVMIGPGAVFDLDRLIKEIEDAEDVLLGSVIYIHKDAIVLQDKHRSKEAETLNGISSTMQGSAAAMIEKIERNHKNDNRAENILGDLDNVVRVPLAVIDNGDWLQVLYENAENILLEGAQGYSLGINAGFWPYCTSRDCTPSRFMSDCQVPIGMLRRVIGTARTYPIRVGNTENGWSGPSYGDQYELTWNEVGVAPETTTVTGRERRVFTFSQSQIREAIQACQPDEVFLNFANYCPDEVEALITTINMYLTTYGTQGGSVRYVGFGPTVNDVRERNMLNPCDYTREEHVAGWNP